MPVIQSNKSKPILHPATQSIGSTYTVGNVLVTHSSLSHGSVNTRNNYPTPTTTYPVNGPNFAQSSVANPLAMNVANSLIGSSTRVKSKSQPSPGYMSMYSGTSSDPPLHVGDKLVPVPTRVLNRTKC